MRIYEDLCGAEDLFFPPCHRPIFILIDPPPLWPIIDNKLLKLLMNKLEKGIENGWSEISADPLEKLFQSMPQRVRHGIDFKGFPCNY